MRAIPITGDRLAVSHRPGWARLYLGYERHAPNHPGKRGLLRLLLEAVVLVRPRPFAWPMRNGNLLAISPYEGLAFAWTVGWTCFQTGRWEEHVERCIRELLRPGDTAINVGANLGYFTTVMAQCVGPQGRVWALEPVPPTFDRLRLSVSLNGLEQVRALPVALGDSDATAEISFDPRFAGSASLHGNSSGEHSESHTVHVRRLDDLVASGAVGRPRLVKIDVEGHELPAVRGALRTLEECRPSIIFEYAHSHARHGGWKLGELGATIASCGDYRFYEIRDDGFRAIADLATYVPPTGGYGTDLLATCEPLASKS